MERCARAHQQIKLLMKYQRLKLQRFQEIEPSAFVWVTSTVFSLAVSMAVEAHCLPWDQIGFSSYF